MNKLLNAALLCVAVSLFSYQTSVAQDLIASIPFVNESAKARIEKEYVAAPKQNKALAITEAGGWGYVQGKETIDEARAGALAQCQKFNPRHPCFIVAENDQMIFKATPENEVLYGGAMELLKKAQLSMDSYYKEDADTGISPTRSYKTGALHAPTPKNVPGAKTIATKELVELIKSSKPVLVNVLNWREGDFAIPGTVWIQGIGSELDNSKMSQLKALLNQVAPDKEAPLVLYCLSWECWMSYNASLAVAELGYKNIYWYRGGIEAWNQARLPVVRTKLFKQL